MKDFYLQLIADHDQDLAKGLDWWRESSDSAKMQVVEAIGREYDDHVMEVMSRFAQIGMNEIILKSRKDQP